MKTVSTIALGLALALGTTASPVLAQKKADAKPAALNLSPDVRKAAVAAQAAIAKNDTAGAQAAIAQAEPAIKTDDDKFVVGQLILSIGQKSNDNAVLAKGIGMMIDSGKTPPDTLPSLLTARAQLAYNAKDYALAESSARAGVAANAPDPNLVPIVVSSMNFEGKSIEGLAYLNDQIAKRKAANQAVPEDWYSQGVNIGYSSKTPAQSMAPTTALTQSWVAAYPTKSHWHDALRIYGDMSKADNDTQLELLRLGQATGSLLGAGEYLEYAEAVYLRYPNEALNVLNEGAAKGLVNPASNKNAAEISTIVKGKVAADRASLPASEKSAATAANGRTALATADGYASYGNYAKAIELYKLAIQKGGVDAPTVNLHMGAALAASGDAAGAKTAFAAVTGPKKAVADFWVIHLDHPTVG